MDAGIRIRRAGYAGFRRNVAVAIGNWLAAADQPPAERLAVLRDALADDDPLVREHAAWALARVSREAAALRDAGAALSADSASVSEPTT